MLKEVAKRALRTAGLDVQRHDPLLDFIPANYVRSDVLPPVNAHAIKRIACFSSHVERAATLPGDLVECGVSIGEGLLLWTLLHEHYGIVRSFVGCDSFEGFPKSSAPDAAHIPDGYYASPMDLVWRMLREGRVSEDTIKRVELKKGFFEQTLPGWNRSIAILSLDCDLKESYETCLAHLFPHVVPGGVVIFDDYGHPRWPGAKEAVDAFFAGRPERIQEHPWGKPFVIKAGS